MVQKQLPPRPRGRPRAYDPDVALARVMDAFWDAGYAGTSLDDLSAATGMNRPSLYAAFGDKRALYLKALERYRAWGRAALKETLAQDQPLWQTLHQVYAKALAVYVSGEEAARGCFTIGTAATEAVGSPEVRAFLAETVRGLDDAFEARFRSARDRGELKPDADPAALARLASAVMHTLAIRSRAGEPRAALEAVAEAGVNLICGPAASAGHKAHTRSTGRGPLRRSSRPR
jgi:TetR/AcrR family transcriptional regulator, copper-responsive repressor